MKKRFLIIFLSASYVCGFSQSIDHVAMLGNYGQYLQGFVDNALLIQNFKPLTEYKSDRYVTMTFNIGTDGSLKNLNVQKSDIPDSLVAMVGQIINASDKGWIPQIKNCQPVLSDTITCFFLFANRSETVSKRINGEEPKLDLSGGTLDLEHDILLKIGQINFCFVFLKRYPDSQLVE